MTAKEIHAEFRKLQRIRKFGDWKAVYFFLALISLLASMIIGPSYLVLWIPSIVFMVLYFTTDAKHEMHQKQYYRLERLLSTYPEELLELILSGNLTGDEITELILFEGLERDFMESLKENQEKLPEDSISAIDWRLSQKDTYVF